jgi:hypothetical protein
VKPENLREIHYDYFETDSDDLSEEEEELSTQEYMQNVCQCSEMEC